MSDVYAGRFAKDVAAEGVPFAGLPRYNFVYGHIDAAKVPVDDMASAARAVILREGHSLGLYHAGHGPQGYRPLREFVVQKVRRRGIGCAADDILLTTGSLQAIELINQIFVEPGDSVILEAFTFGLAVSKAQRRGGKVIAAPMDSEGLDVDALQGILAGLRRDGQKPPKYIYTIPTVHNPTGTVLSLERREKLIALSREFGVPIIEDECYADLHWDGETPASIYSLDPGRVVHVGSFSKTLSPALRIGYVLADWTVIGRMVDSKADAGSSGLDQMVAAEYLPSHFDTHVAELSAELQRKLEVMIDAVEREFGTSVEVHRPKGGILLWLQFPDHVDVRTFHRAALAEGVAFNAGSDWACDPDSAKNYMRLCFALPTEQDIEEGIALLASVMHRSYGIPERGANFQR